SNTLSAAEHTMALLLAQARNIPQAHAALVAGRWERNRWVGTELADKTLGVVGLARIGKLVAQRALACGVQILAHDPYVAPDRARQMNVELVDLDQLLARSDFVTLHVAKTPETLGLINAERLAASKPGIRIVNVARGGIVDEQALADAIESGHVAGAAIDVFEEEPPTDRRLVNLPQVLATPHLGASTDEAQELVAVEAADIISGFLLRNEIRFAVNMAPVSAAEMQELRIYLDLSRRLGLLLAQWSRNQQLGLKAATLEFRGEAAELNTTLMLDAFTAGLLETALDRSVNLVNAATVAKDRGIAISSIKPPGRGDFSSVITARIETDSGELKAAGTVFGHSFLRLVRLGQFPLEAYLDGLLLVYRHRDVPGLIGYIGSICGEHQVNIAHMALGREKNEQGGDSVAVLNLDNEPSAEVLKRISEHPEVTGVELFRLPAAGAPLPWLGGTPG
ncbi:MAG: phosphoglycerate dehydrogenase, partial [Planctomycetaceae bacterium]|nr:phosphoglycerate dehydrogenase [Planctomycetaceae bacterium]